MTQPQPGTLKYIIIKKTSVSVRRDNVRIIITDGTTARVNDEKSPKDANLHNIPHQILVQLWRTGTPATMKQWREATKKRDEALVSNTLDEILRVMDSSAVPKIANIIVAAQGQLILTEKMAEWNKLNNLLQSLDEQRLRQFISLMFVLLISKSEGE